MANKNKKILDSFVAYCKEYPEMRFWQALRNWCGASFIGYSRDSFKPAGQPPEYEDTFYWNQKDS
jgi:hypothetical protein